MKSSSVAILATTDWRSYLESSVTPGSFGKLCHADNWSSVITAPRNFDAGVHNSILQPVTFENLAIIING
jgi:hypothetical protein